MRIGRVVEIAPDIFSMWQPCINYIAQLEPLMVYVALMTRARDSRGARGVWFINNIAALMALVRGRSGDQDLDKLAELDPR